LSFETDVFPAWLKRGIPIDVVSCDAPFIDIGTEESLGLADNFIRDHADWFQRD
jgi:NDP-sugar pyrophosphorylase family protein